MTKLYVANATRQIQEIQFRLPEKTAPIMQRVHPGTQIPIAGDLTSNDVTEILKQHTRYGWVEASAVDRTKPFVGIVYSIDKPVPQSRIVSALEHNIEVLQERGKANRDLAAVAMNSELERQLSKSRLAELHELDVEITEEDRPGRDSTIARISEGRVVSHNAPPTPERTGSKKDRRRAA